MDQYENYNMQNNTSSNGVNNFNTFSVDERYQNGMENNLYSVDNLCTQMDQTSVTETQNGLGFIRDLL